VYALSFTASALCRVLRDLHFPMHLEISDSGVAWGGCPLRGCLGAFRLGRPPRRGVESTEIFASLQRTAKPTVVTAASDDCFLGTILHCRRDIDAKLQDPRLQDRPVVFYCQTRDNFFTNTILMLAAYLLLVKGHTVERALLPFAIIHRLPIVDYLDATWYDAHPPTILLPDIRASA
jgi:hypothetical protein